MPPFSDMVTACTLLLPVCRKWEVLTWLAWKGAILVFPTWVAGMVTLVVWVFLTGGLHLDGLADCCDGLLASTAVERRLEIMKDPHVGAFGVIGAGLGGTGRGAHVCTGDGLVVSIDNDAGDARHAGVRGGSVF